MARNRSANGLSLTGFSIAVVGAYIAFLPLMQILLPLKAAHIAADGGAALLGLVAACGAVAAGAANFAVGWLSDRTTSRFGRRRPWIVAGLAGIIASYGAIWQSQTIVALIVSFVVFQIMFNMLFSPLLALVADRIVTDRRGRVSALVGLGQPVAAIVGTVVIESLLTRESDRFLILGAMVLVTVMPFAYRLGPDPAPGVRAPMGGPGNHPRRWLSRNFALALLSRVGVVMAFTVTQLYLLFYLQAIMPGAPTRVVGLALTIYAIVFGVLAAGAGIAAGRISDRTRRRRPLVLTSAVVIGIAMAALAVAPSWPFAAVAYALFAIGAGVHTVVEFAMVIDILPSPDRAARDLGILNLSNIAPQIVAPLIVTWILSMPGSTIQWAFAAAALAAAGGAVMIAFMRAVK